MLGGWSSLLWAALAVAPADDPFLEIRALDSAAAFELDAIRGRCGDPKAPDREAEAGAERAALIHLTRIGLARQRTGATSEDLVALAFQAADAYQRAFACNGEAIRHLEAAHGLLVGMRAELNEPRSVIAQALDRRIAELAGQIAAWKAGQPPPPEQRPQVRIVVLDGDVRPGPQDSWLGRLALRVEGGASFLRAGDPPTYFYHRGPQVRVAALARFAVAPRTHLLFGAYYGSSRVYDLRGEGRGDIWWRGDMSLHRVGAQFEAQWVPSARLGPWLSLNPALEVGLETQLYGPGRGSGRASGFQVGGGLALCIWHASVCPGARVLASPLAGGRAVVTAQVGLAVDLLRFVDVGVTRRSRKRSPRAAAG